MELSFLKELGGLLLRTDTKGIAKMIADAGEDALIDFLGGKRSIFGLAASELLKEGRIDPKQVFMEMGRNLTAAERADRQQWWERNSWRFDWRSQPRRPAGYQDGGEWMAGRLDHPVVAQKPLISRSQRQARVRAIKAYRKRQRALGKTSFRKVRTSFGEF